ncbi:MAG: class I SAM-dependent methyltransferase [Acidimicrobiales bacterium]
MNPELVRQDTHAGGTGPLRRVSALLQTRRWSRTADHWDDGGATGLGKVVEAVLSEVAATPAPVALAVDIGAGTGSLAIPLAGQVGSVTAVDISPTMLEVLQRKARAAGVENVKTVACPVEELDLDPGSVDLIVSNYALHHLRDRDKAVLVGQIATWLRPGGKVVIGDMMLGRGGDPADRAIMASKVRVMLQKGLPGWWRVAKNAWRYLTRTRERPVSLSWWTSALAGAGLVDVTGRRVVAEAGVVTALRPAPATASAAGA